MFHKSVIRAGRRILAGALPLAVAATLASAGTASATDPAAQQARWAENLTASGTTQNIDYRTTVAPDLKTVSTALSSGKFTLAPDASAVSVESATGAKIAELPSTLKTAAGKEISLKPQVSADGRSLVVAPEVSPEVAAELKTIAAELKPVATNPNAQNSDPVANGAAAGALVGLAIAAIVCLPALAAFVIGYLACLPMTGLIDAVIGAAFGALIGAVAPHVIPQVLP